METTHIYLEHANITVNNLDESIRFFQSAFPDFFVRGGGEMNGRKWIHLGNERTYLALNELEDRKGMKHTNNYLKNGFNHIGFVVEDIDALATRLLAAGFERDYPKQVEKFRIRDYFADADGNEFEFVQYLSDKLEERNSFEG